MALNLKLLYCGTLGTVVAGTPAGVNNPVYTVPASKSALIKSIILYNPGTAQSVSVQVQPATTGTSPGGGNWGIVALTPTASLGATPLQLLNEITLAAGDKIEAWAATTANTIQIIICGLERDV